MQMVASLKDQVSVAEMSRADWPLDPPRNSQGLNFTQRTNGMNESTSRQQIFTTFLPSKIIVSRAKLYVINSKEQGENGTAMTNIRNTRTEQKHWRRER